MHIRSSRLGGAIGVVTTIVFTGITLISTPIALASATEWTPDPGFGVNGERVTNLAAPTQTDTGELDLTTAPDVEPY